MKAKRIAKPEPRHCEHCKSEFKPNSDGMTISHGEYLSRGLTWFCNETCSENYTNENGY